MRLGLVFVILCGCNDGRLVAVGVGTDAGPDAASPDAAPPGTVATPRLVAPLSTVDGDATAADVALGEQSSRGHAHRRSMCRPRVRETARDRRPVPRWRERAAECAAAAGLGVLARPHVTDGDLVRSAPPGSCGSARRVRPPLSTRAAAPRSTSTATAIAICSSAPARATPRTCISATARTSSASIWSAPTGRRIEDCIAARNCFGGTVADAATSTATATPTSSSVRGSAARRAARLPRRADAERPAGTAHTPHTHRSAGGVRLVGRDRRCRRRQRRRLRDFLVTPGINGPVAPNSTSAVATPSVADWERTSARVSRSQGPEAR